MTCPVCEAVLPAPVVAGPDRLQGTPGRFAVAVCARCGTGRTVPPATDAELATFYPEGYGPYEARAALPVRAISWAIHTRQATRARRTPPLDAVRALPAARGLDVGAGRGDLSAMLVARGWAMTAVEPSANACAAARSRGVDARSGTLRTVALDEGAYAFAVFQQSLEHVEDPVGDLRIATRALGLGGLVLVSVPNFGSWQARRFASRWYHLDLPRHRVHFTRASLVRALAAAGLEPVSTATSTSAAGLAASVQYALLGRCLFPSGLALRVASGLAVLAVPLARALDRRAGEGDLLHAVARRPA